MTRTPPRQARDRRFCQVDVFTATAYRGNPLAVVLDGSGLDDETMQRFARWTHLSETTFLLPATLPEADYRVRIFTPGGELPFAGHPTLGSCHAWLEAGGAPRQDEIIVQECQVGLVQIRRDAPRLAFAAPPVRRSTPVPALVAQVVDALGLKAAQVIEARMLDNGPVWMGLLLDQPASVLRLAPNHPALEKLGYKVGVAAIYRSPPTGAATPLPTLEVRAFAAPIGIDEDPVTGSLNASLAQWLIADQHLPTTYIAAQGSCLDRDGRVHIACDPTGQVWVGGESVSCISGTVSL